MMDTLERLVQISRLELDRRRREIGELQTQRNRLREQVVELDRRIEVEKTAAGADPVLSPRLGSYIQAVRVRQERLDAGIEELDERIEAKREDVAAAFREVKRNEKLLAHRELQRRLAAARREQHRMDEIGLRLAAATRA